MNVREMMERRATLLAQARGILEGAEREHRDMSQEETDQWNALMGEVTGLTAKIDMATRQLAAESSLANPVQAASRPDMNPGESRAVQIAGGRRIPDSPEYRAAFASYLRGGPEALNVGEARALQADNDTLGGYLLAPLQFVQGLIQAVDNAVYMRQWATVMQVTNADGLGAVSLDSDPADPSWTSELLIGDEDSSMAFGKRELRPHPLAKYIKLSRKLIQRVPNSESLAQTRLGYKFSVTMESNYMTGNGAGEPLGVFVASNDGISTSRDYSTGNTTTELRFDGLIGAKYQLKSQYWPRARWLFHRDGVAQIAKLKDGNGQYLWRESVRVGEPDRALNFPVYMSEYAPNTFTTGLYVGILGDFQYYWIADSLALEVQRLVELFAATNQIGLVGRMESDGLPVLGEAFVRVKLA